MRLEGTPAIEAPSTESLQDAGGVYSPFIGEKTVESSTISRLPVLVRSAQWIQMWIYAGVFAQFTFRLMARWLATMSMKCLKRLEPLANATIFPAGGAHDDLESVLIAAGFALMREQWASILDVPLGDFVKLTTALLSALENSID